MTGRPLVRLLIMAVLLAAPAAQAQQAPDLRVAGLVRAGKVRAALFLPLYSKDPVTGELRGIGAGAVSVEITRALAARLGVEFDLLGYLTPPDVIDCLKAGSCDLSFMGTEDPARAAELIFSPPFLALDYTFLVPAGSSAAGLADVDRPGVRIAVVRNHMSTRTLGRLLKHAQTIAADIPEAAFEILRSGQADALASVRPILLDYSAKLSGSRVVEERYGANLLAVAISKARPDRLAYINEFVEEIKASGLVERMIEQAGLRGIQAIRAGKND